MADLVQMKGIEKRFPGVHALKSAEFNLRAGEVHALMGENGAGKSTLMKILSGVYKPDEGTILLNGEPATVGSPRAAQEKGICIIHQELALLKDLNVAQNIFIGREPRLSFGRLDEEKLNKDAVQIFSEMNIPIDPTASVADMTVAMQQMVEIAKALSFRSRVLIMDEPTAALNDKEIAELFTFIRKLRAEGVGIVYISHKMDEIKRISDRITVMRDGAYVGTVEAAETPITKIISMMVGRDLDDSRPVIPDLSAAETMLSVKGLNRGKMVRDVSFELKKGEILGFAGLMGAGRTEVARVIFGADKRDSGDIIIKGIKRDISTPKDGVEAGVGYLSEDRKHLGLAVTMDVRANTSLASLKRYANAIGHIDEAKLEEIAVGFIKRLGIRTPSDEQEVRLLSGGNQQKVVIAKWLLRDCDILIFDEPTRGIDIGAKTEIYNLLHDLAKQGKAIIVISSELPEVLRLAHRVAVMCEGRLTGILPGDTTQEAIMTLATQRHAPEGGNHVH